MYFHGGGWVYGDLDSHDPACRFLAERSGVRILSVDYRLAPEHPFPAAYDDAVTAYRWVVEHAASLGADPARIGVGGDSAGGTLAAATAVTAAREGLPLALQLLVYPGTDMTTKSESRRLFGRGFYLTDEFMDVAKGHYLPDELHWPDPAASPLLGEVPPGLAPAYVATAGFDPLRDEGEAYARKLADAGVEVELRRFPDQIHGFLNVVGAGRTARAASAEVAARLAAGLGPRAGRRSVDERLRALGEHLFDVRRGSRQAHARQQVRLAEPAPCGALGADRDASAGEHRLEQVGQRRGVREGQPLRPPGHPEPGRLAGQPQRHVGAGGHRGGRHGEALVAALGVVGAGGDLHDERADHALSLEPCPAALDFGSCRSRSRRTSTRAPHAWRG